MPEDGSQIGACHRKVDGFERLTGSGVFADDINLPRMLHGKILRSPHPHARILSIDASAASSMEGVHAVVTGKDFTIPYGVLPRTPDENALAVEKVCYVGDGVACVAAETEEIATRAVSKIHVEYEVLQPIFDPEEALASPNVINPYSDKGNLSKDVRLSFGDIDGEFERADLVIEGDYHFHGMTHGAIEPHCAVARAERTGVTVWSSTQVPHYLHRTLSKVLELPAQSVRVIQPMVGGAFGGKSEPFDFELCVAKLAMLTGRPVKILYTREEVFYSHRGRHPMRMKFRTAVSRDGRFLASDSASVLDGGAYSSFGLATSYYSGQLAVAPYVLKAFRFHSRRAYTNKPACGPKRGHGSVQPRFAIEVQIDKAARALGIDPIEIRRRNAMAPNTRTINEFLVGSNGFLECLKQVEARSDWATRRATLPYGHGLGVAGSSYISGTNYCVYPNDMPQAAVEVALDRSGRARVTTGASDIGQGSNTMVAVIVCQELGIETDDVRVLAADTDLCPVDLGAYSSRITLMVGNACLSAARALRRRVTRAVAKRWEVKGNRVVLANRVALDREQPERSVPIATAFQWAESDGGLLSEAGSYDTPKDRHGSYRGAPIGASPAYSFTAHVAEVLVDPETGEVDVVKIWCAHDCGRALSKRLVEGQIEGSTYMGAAEALMEHHEIDASTGLHVGPSFLEYRMPTAADTPEIEAIIVEAPDERGPYGAKEAGEGPLHSSIPAIANAIYDAVGVRIDEVPFRPEAICRAIDERTAAEGKGTLQTYKKERRAC